MLVLQDALKPFTKVLFAAVLGENSSYCGSGLGFSGVMLPSTAAFCPCANDDSSGIYTPHLL